MIRLGICTGAENAAAAAEMGYDYIELGFTPVARLEEAEFAALCETIDAAKIPVEAMNSMLPGEFRLCGPDGTGEEIRAFLEGGFARAEKLGVKIVVFGSGGARRIPDGMSEAEAYDWLEKYLRMAAPIAASHGIRIAIEPLRAAECNILNYVREAQMLAARVNDPAVAALADMYHMAEGGDDMKDLDNGIGVIHAHIACPGPRTYPMAGDGGEAVYGEFFGKLKSAGYSGRVSIEGGTKDFMNDAPKGLALLRTLA